MFYRAHIIQNSLRLEIKGTNPQLLPKFYVQKCRRERFFGFEFIIKIYLIEFHKTPLSLSNLDFNTIYEAQLYMTIPYTINEIDFVEPNLVGGGGLSLASSSYINVLFE